MRGTKYKKGKKAPAFIFNLHRILVDSSNHPYIKWLQDGESFIILNVPKFTEMVLPQYYKHSNYSSFVRQLNMYNFNKMRSELESQHVFRNQLFVKDSQENLKNIKRREVVTSSQINILSLAHALNSQTQEQNQMIEAAAPSLEFSFFVDSPSLQCLRLTHSLSDYLFETNKTNSGIPSIIPLGLQEISYPFRSTLEQIKVSQNQLQQVCIDLYQMNQFLTGQNMKLQEKLKTEFKKKQQILNQIIKYVIIFLSQWNGNYKDIDQQSQCNPQTVISEEQSSPDIVLESYEMFDQRKFQKKNSSQKKNKNFNKGFKFSKYAKNQKKILLTLLKQIEKSYNQKFFFTGVDQSSNYQYEQNSSNYNQKYSSSSANSFLISMLLKFIQSNNLTQVVKRFSLLLNLERNKKSKNFTFVNYMKDLTEHFKMGQLEKLSQFEHDFIIRNKQKNYETQGLQYFVDKQRYLQNQMETINQMEKQLTLITNHNNNQKQLRFIQSGNFNFQQECEQQVLRSKHENFKINEKPQQFPFLSVRKNEQFYIKDYECFDKDNFVVNEFNFRPE